jgi:hypothetical protein
LKPGWLRADSLNWIDITKIFYHKCLFKWKETGKLACGSLLTFHEVNCLFIINPKRGERHQVKSICFLKGLDFQA